MKKNQTSHVEYGTGQKQLSTYLLGTSCCVILTLAAFWVTMAEHFTRLEAITFIYIAALLQFYIQLVCFLRLNLQSLQAKFNVMSFVFTGVILTSIVAGTLWIMINLNYNMGH